MSKPPKIDRKELNRPDEFLQQGRHVLELMAGYQTQILSGIATIAVIAAGAYFYSWKMDSKNEQGWKEFAQVMKSSETERWDRFKKLAEDYSSVALGQFVAVQLADHYFDEAKKLLEKDPKSSSSSSALSIEWYSNALKYSKLSPNEKGVLLINRAGAYELVQKWDEAMNDYAESAKIGFEGKPIALLGQARVYEVKKDSAKAIETYEKISADFLNTEYGKIAKSYLRRLKSPLFGESKS